MYSTWLKSRIPSQFVLPAVVYILQQLYYHMLDRYAWGGKRHSAAGRAGNSFAVGNISTRWTLGIRTRKGGEMLAVWTAGLPFSANKECPYISCLQRRSKVLSPTLCSPATQSVAPLRSEASCTVFFYRKLPLNRLHEQRVRNPCRTAKFFANEESTRRLPDSKRAAVDVGSEFLLSLVVASSTFALAANAYEGYEGLGVPNDQATPLENGFGLLFTAFCCWYFLKVVKKRAARAKDIRLSNTSSVRSSHHHSALFLILFPAERRAQTAQR